MILLDKNIIKINPSNAKTLEEIPIGNWLVQRNPQTGEFYLEKQPDFVLPEKIYGNPEAKAMKFLNTFHKKGKNLGVLLKGKKGTGKTLLAKMICVKSELPVILITAPYSGPQFEQFISQIKQKVVVYIDEFEKVYSDKYDDTEGTAQNVILTLLDGVFEGQKLFILTANEHLPINENLINRPGRIHYLKEYEYLEKEVIEEIVNDILVNKEYKEELLLLEKILGGLNVDSLITLIEEINLYGERPKEAVKDLNISASNDTDYEITYTKKIRNNGKVIEAEYSGFLFRHPLSKERIEFTGHSNEFGHNHNYIKLEEADSVDIKDNGEIIIKYNNVEYVFKKRKSYRFTF